MVVIIMNWYKKAQNVPDPSKPNISSSPVIEDKNVYWKFEFLNAPLEVNVSQVIHRATEYLRAVNSAIFQNTEAVGAMSSGGGLANVSSENPWTINVDFQKIENEVKDNIQNELQRLEQEQMSQLGPERMQELRMNPQEINNAFVEELTSRIQDEVVREYAQVLAHEAQHNLQMDATRSEKEVAKENVLNGAKAILSKSPGDTAALESEIEGIKNVPLTNETLSQFNTVLQNVFRFVIDNSDAKELANAVAQLNQIQYMPESQAESEAEKAEQIAV